MACIERRGDAIVRARRLRITLAPQACTVCKVSYVPRTTKQMVCGTECRTVRYRALAIQQARRKRVERAEAEGRVVGPRGGQNRLYATKKEANAAAYARKKARKAAARAAAIEAEHEARAAGLRPARWDVVPCEGCVHGETMAEATFGVSCAIGRWRVCNPLLPGATPYEPRMVPANG